MIMNIKRLIAGAAAGVGALTLCAPLQINAAASDDEYVEQTDFPLISYHILNDHVEVVKNPKIKELEDIILNGVAAQVEKAQAELDSLLAGITTSDIIIQDTINGLPVTGIAYQCFYGDDTIKSIVLPDTITMIAGSAFEKCSELVSITIKNPDCNLVTGVYYSISNDTERLEWKEGKKRFSKYVPKFSGTIYGYEDSTAQAYADKYDFKFEPLKNENLSSLLGDLNGDGKIDSVDASNLLQAYAVFATGQAQPTEHELAVSDVNYDGKIDSVDASKVLSYYAYISSSGSQSFIEFLKKI
jgi:hypothetical protein